MIWYPWLDTLFMIWYPWLDTLFMIWYPWLDTLLMIWYPWLDTLLMIWYPWLDTPSLLVIVPTIRPGHSDQVCQFYPRQSECWTWFIRLSLLQDESSCSIRRTVFSSLQICSDHGHLSTSLKRLLINYFLIISSSRSASSVHISFLLLFLCDGCKPTSFCDIDSSFISK